MIPDMRFGKKKSGSQANTASVDAFLSILYASVAETMPDKFLVHCHLYHVICQVSTSFIKFPLLLSRFSFFVLVIVIVSGFYAEVEPPQRKTRIWMWIQIIVMEKICVIGWTLPTKRQCGVLFNQAKRQSANI